MLYIYNVIVKDWIINILNIYVNDRNEIKIVMTCKS